jgi:hypothetical protein
MGTRVSPWLEVESQNLRLMIETATAEGKAQETEAGAYTRLLFSST